MNYHDYFKNLATQHAIIAHQDEVHNTFCRLEYGEDKILYQGNLESDTFLCLFGLPELRIGDRLSDNVHEYQTIELYFVKRCDIQDFATIRQVQQEAKIIAYQFLGKIYKDVSNGIIHGFDRNTLTGQYCDKIPSKNEYGFMLSFVISHSINKQIHYKPEHWL